VALLLYPLVGAGAFRDDPDQKEDEVTCSSGVRVAQTCAIDDKGRLPCAGCRRGSSAGQAMTTSLGRNCHRFANMPA